MLLLLLMPTSPEVQSHVGQAEDFDTAKATGDLLGVWRITKHVVVGQSSVSLYNMLTKWLSLKQGNTPFPEFLQKFRQLLQNMENVQPLKADLFDALVSAVFIMNIDQEYFKDKLLQVRSNRKCISRICQ